MSSKRKLGIDQSNVVVVLATLRNAVGIFPNVKVQQLITTDSTD